jgi:bacillolysin
MANGFVSLSLSGRASNGDEFDFRSSAIPTGVPRNNEVIARRYLESALTQSDVPAFRSVGASESPARVPSLTLADELRSPFGANNVVRFTQTHQSIPVYGSRAVVELDAAGGLAHLGVELADSEMLDETVDMALSVSPRDALAELARHADLDDPDASRIPRLVFYQAQDSERFVLCWLFEAVSVRSVDLGYRPDDKASTSWGWEGGDRRPQIYDFLFDSATGEQIAALSQSRAMAGPPSIPIICTGDDEDDVTRTFDANQAPGGGFEMVDPIRVTRTFDFGYAPYDPKAKPALPPVVSNPTTSWGQANPAAVTAHVNAATVHDFFETFLHRQGVDGMQMSLDSVVNCSDRNGSADFMQAYWTGERMLYGQVPDSTGNLRSLGRYLEVVAHELFHGITQHTAKLEYQGESGALNESFSDIYGVIVANLTLQGPDTSEWDWRLGSGLAPGGGILRDMSNPAMGSPSQPSNMAGWVTTTSDHGGVHTNSGIHNFAAYTLLTSAASDGAVAFPPDELARMYYFVLMQLTSNAGFSDVRKKLIETSNTRRQGDPRCSVVVTAIEHAYDAAGIN